MADATATLGAFLEAIYEFLGKSFFPIFQDERVAIGLSLVIIVSAAVVISWLKLRKEYPTRATIARLRRTVLASADGREFLRNFDGVSEAMKTVPIVRHSWGEFVETLIFPESPEQLVIRNTARPSVYLNLAAAEHVGLNLRFFQAVPNYFVGVGLILTFIGLVAALFFATESIASGNEADVLSGIQNLLAAASFKFLTSIAGILSSILIAVTYRTTAGNLETSFESLCQALEARLQLATPESIAFDQYKELQKQTNQLERFNTDLAFSIATELNKVLNETLRANLASVMAPVAETLKGMAGRFGEMNQDAIQRMLGEFQKSLSGAAGSELSQLAAGLGAAVVPLKALGETLAQQQDQMREMLANASKSLTDSATAMRDSIQGGTKESMAHMTESIRHLSTHLGSTLGEAGLNLGKQLTDAGQAAAGALAPVATSIAELGTVADALAKSLREQLQQQELLQGELRSVVDATTKAAQDLRGAGEPARQAATRMEAAASQLASVGQVVAQSHQSLQVLVASLERNGQRFEGLDKALANTFDTFEKGARGYHEAVREFVLKVDEELKNALSTLGGGIEGLDNTVEELADVMDRHTKAVVRSNGGQPPLP